MKKPFVRVLSVSLCALLALGGGTCVLASGQTEPATGTSEPVSTGSRLPASSSRTPDAVSNAQDETVYVLTDAAGGVRNIIVSDWLQNCLGSETIRAATELTGIENVKGYEGFTLDGDGACVWDAQGNDIYFQGAIDKELPVTVTVSYTLNGQPVTPEELAGRSGRVVIRFDYENRQYETVELNGGQEKIYVPFTMLTGLLLDSSRFTNVEVSNGRLLNDGSRTIVAGVAFPGLQESLGLDAEQLELPDYVEVTADVTDFALETTVTIASNRLFDGLAEQADGSVEELDNLSGGLQELSDAMAQLMDGSSRLYDGLCTLLERSGELTAGISQLADGAEALKNGADELNAGAAQLQAGAASLRDGLNTLSANNDALNAGAGQVFASLLSAADNQLAAAGLELPALTADNYAQVLDSAIAAAQAQGSPAAEQVAALKGSLDSYSAFYMSLQGYTAGVAQSAQGAGELSTGAENLLGGAGSLKEGSSQLYGGILTLKDGSPALVEGVTQLRDGAMELSSGLKEFDEQGIQKLSDAVNGDLAGLRDRLEAVRDVSARYQSFAGLSEDMDGQVKFIWRTEAVE